MDEFDVVRRVEWVPSELDTYGYKRDFRTALPQFLAVMTKNLLLMSFGCVLGFPTILIPAIRGDNGMDEVLLVSTYKIPWISSIGYVIVPIGCAFSGLLTNTFGRKITMMYVNIPFICSWIIFYVSVSASSLCIALGLGSFGGGLMESAILLYVAEITQPHLRGFLSATGTMFIILGVCSQFFMALWLHWKKVALVNLALPIITFICLFFVPESPFWLILNNENNASKKSLAWLRGWTTVDKINNEYNDLQTLASPESRVNYNYGSFWNKIRTNLSYITNRTFYIPFFLTCFAFFIGHFSGMTTLQTYAVLIFETLKVPIDKTQATLYLGIAQILGTITCVSVVYYTGRRVLVLFSTIGVAVCFIVCAGYSYKLQMDTQTWLFTLSPMIDGANQTSTEWVPMSSLILSAYLSHCGLRLLPWILIGEVFSPETRAMASGVAGGIGYIFGFLANFTFIKMVNVLTLPSTFLVYGGISLLGAYVFYKILPETEGYTLNEITKHFSGEAKLPNKVKRVMKNKWEDMYKEHEVWARDRVRQTPQAFEITTF